MSYRYRPFVCLRVAESLKKIESALPIAIRNKVRVLTVSFGISRDDAAAPKAMVDERHINTNVWKLARSVAPHTRNIAEISGT